MNARDLGLQEELLNRWMTTATEVLQSFPKDYRPQGYMGAADSDDFFTGQDSNLGPSELLGSLPTDMIAAFQNTAAIVLLVAGECALRYPETTIPKQPEGIHIDERSISRAVEAAIPGEQGALFPFRETLITLLGDHAIRALFTRGHGQHGGAFPPYLLERQNWHKLGRLRDQIEIETELIAIQRLDSLRAKMVVAAAWTMVALASHMPAALFVTEHAPHLLHVTRGGVSIGSGRYHHVIRQFRPNSLVTVLQLLRRALDTRVMDANDLMWTATSLAEVEQTVIRGRAVESPGVPRHRIFLSHRGKDAKAVLMDAILGGERAKEAFLDCLSMPRSVINRLFLYQSLTWSQEVLIIRTQNFHASSWCRKEAWIAEALAGLTGIRMTVLSNVDQATEYLESLVWGPKVEEHNAAGPSDEATSRSSWTTARILKDMTEVTRAPNLWSVTHNGYPANLFDPLVAWLRRPGPSIDGLGIAARQHVTEAFAKILDWGSCGPRLRERSAVAFGAPLDMWATAVKLCVAGVSLATKVYDKTITRHALDGATDQVERTMRLYDDHGEADASEFQNLLMLIAACVAIDLSCYEPKTIEAAAHIVREVAIVHDGVPLLDVRVPGSRRDRLLRFLVGMARSDLGVIGIIQNGRNPVHNEIVDALSLEVLPCVTLHPGMERIIGAIPV